MNRRLLKALLVVPFIIGFLIGMPATAATGSCHGGSGTESGSYWLRCEMLAQHNGGGPLGPGGGGAPGRTYLYLWLPSCPGAWPGVPGAEQMDCRGAHSCVNPRLLSLTLFSELVDADGGVIDPWRYMRSRCLTPSHIGPGDPRKTLSWEDIRTAIRKVPVPPALVEGPAYTLVNLRTTFYTHAESIDKSLVILGFRLDLHIVPVSYIWHWGDDTTSTTSVPGRPYPATDVTHTYRHATAAGATVPLRVDVAYQAHFRVDGGAWNAVNDRLVIAGTTRQLPVKQASAVLVPNR